MKKDEGSVIHMFSIILTAVFMGLLLMIFAAISSNINRRNDVDLTARKYMLKMEIEGGLTEDLKVELTKELEKLGVQEIKYDGSTFVNDTSPSNYGETINLNISGKMKFITYNNKVNKTFTVSQMLIPLNIKKSTTSKN